MTSSDGITWTSRTSAANNDWESITYGNNLFVAVSTTGTGNRVMTSSDGITWTSRTSAANNNWYSVTYGNNLFVAVSTTGTGNRVMTSSDGITWTSRTSAADINWESITYGNGLFVAVASSGTGNRVMTSPSAPTITNFSIPSKIFGDAPFTITAPTSNSTGSFSYTSSNTLVATIFENIITILSAGTSDITAIQAETTDYTSGTITTLFSVEQSTPENPVNITNDDSLIYFMNSDSIYAIINDSINLSVNLIAGINKSLTTSNNDVKIYKNI
jgi:predicted RecA/RadA family phage recombinase